MTHGAVYLYCIVNDPDAHMPLAALLEFPASDGPTGTPGRRVSGTERLHARL